MDSPTRVGGLFLAGSPATAAGGFGLARRRGWGGGSTITLYKLFIGVFNHWAVFFDYTPFLVFISQLILISKAPTLGVRRHGFLWIMSEGSAGAACSQA